MRSATASNAHELGAALDRAARSLEELRERGAELSLNVDGTSGGLRILLEDEGGRRRLTPGELFELLEVGAL